MPIDTAPPANRRLALKPGPPPAAGVPEQTLLTPEAAATRLAVSPATLERWRVRREGPPFVKLGRLVRYRGADLDAYVRAHTTVHG